MRPDGGSTGGFLYRGGEPAFTPVERTTGLRVREDELVVVPILRAGLGMVRGAEVLLPGARIGHVGLTRDEESLEPRQYYFKIPSDEDASRFLVVDPMLATGGTASAALEALERRGVEWIRFVCLVAAPEGVERLLDEHRDVPVYSASLDRGLSDEGWVVPGLGDAGDRLFGTR